MSFWCNDNCRLPGGSIGRGVCRCCPTAEYYRNQYKIDERGRAFIRSIDIPLPINLPNLDLTAYGYYFSTYTVPVPPQGVIPLNGAGFQGCAHTAFDGIINLAKPGIYSVDYTVYTSSGGSIALRLNNVILAETEISGADVITGSTIINSNTAPATLAIVNTGANNIDLAPHIPGNITAQLNIVQIK